jgi:hypothetical protein
MIKSKTNESANIKACYSTQCFFVLVPKEIKNNGGNA